MIMQIRSSFSHFCASAAITLLLVPGIALAQLHGVNPFSNAQVDGVDGDGGLFRLDVETGEIAFESVVFPTAGGAILGLNALTIDPTTGIYYAILRQTGVTGRLLATVDVGTSDATIVGNLGDNFSSLTFRSDGQLFGVTGDGAAVPETLFSIDKSTAATSVAVTLGNGADGEVIAYNPNDDHIYHWSGGGTVVFERILAVAPFTVTGIPVTGAPGGETFGAVWDGCRDRFLVHDLSSRMKLWSVTGEVTDPQPVTVADVRGLALVGGNTCDADLSVTMTAMPLEPLPDDPVMLSVDVANAGPARARGNVITFDLPPNLSAATTSGCTEDPIGIPTCTVPTLLAGETHAVTISASHGGGAGFATATVNTSSDDTVGSNDSARVLLGPVATVDPSAGLQTSEPGDADGFTVVLNAEPTADVVIDLVSDDASEGTASPSTLTFTAANWNDPQQVGVMGVDDDVDDGEVGYHIVLAAAISTDTAFNGREVVDVDVANGDDDLAGITIVPLSDLATSESGISDSVSVVLNSEPTADVTIPVSSDDGSEGVVSVPQLVFASGNWDVPQILTVSGVDDALDDGNVAYGVVIGAGVSADPIYDQLAGATIGAINVDDDGATSFGNVSFAGACGVAASEAQGAIEITVLRSRGSDSVAGVEVSTVDSSAASPDDYAALTQTLTWGLLDESPRQISIALENDGVAESAENLAVLLANPTGGATLGTPSEILVHIRNGVFFGNGFETPDCP
jgi:hypothetical protein